MLFLAVTMIIKPGRMEAFLAEYQKLRPLVLAEKGCLSYDYTREIQTEIGIQEPVNPDRITLYERWESLEDLQVHESQPHMATFMERVKDMREKVSLRIGQPV